MTESTDIEWFFLALALIWVILVAAHYIRHTSTLLSYLFLPGSVIAGLAALCVGPDGLSSRSPVALVPSSYRPLTPWRSVPSPPPLPGPPGRLAGPARPARPRGPRGVAPGDRCLAAPPVGPRSRLPGGAPPPERRFPPPGRPGAPWRPRPGVAPPGPSPPPPPPPPSASLAAWSRRRAVSAWLSYWAPPPSLRVLGYSPPCRRPRRVAPAPASSPVFLPPRRHPWLSRHRQPPVRRSFFAGARHPGSAVTAACASARLGC